MFGKGGVTGKNQVYLFSLAINVQYFVYVFTEAVFGNYASPPEYKTSETFVLYNIPIWGWFLIALPIMGVVIICLALTVWKIIVYVTKFDHK